MPSAFSVAVDMTLAGLTMLLERSPDRNCCNHPAELQYHMSTPIKNGFRVTGHLRFSI